MAGLMRSLRGIKQALDEAEAAHPGSPALQALHGRLWAALNYHRDILGLGDGDVSTFSGGTNKEVPPPPEDGE